MTADHSPAKHSFAKLPVLSNERITLREIALHEAAAVIDICVYDGVFAADEAGSALILERINADVAKGESLHWGIFINETKKAAGTCGFYRGFDGDSGEIGYILKAGYRGQGLMTEAVGLLVAFGFETLNLQNIVAYTEPGNSASVAVLRRAGFSEVKSPNADRKFARHRPPQTAALIGRPDMSRK